MSNPTVYWTFANDAIKLGLITKKEADTIARVGHRKQRYWARHLRDIKSLVEQRLEERRVVDADNQAG